MAVDAARSRPIAEERLGLERRGRLPARRRLERHLGRPGRSSPTASISFPVVVTARQVPILDPPRSRRRSSASRSRRPRDPRRVRRGRPRGLARLGRHDPDHRLAGRGDHRRTGRRRDPRAVAVTSILGLDLGERRIGVAIADVGGLAARPLDDAPAVGATCGLDAAGAPGAHRRARDRRARRRPAARGGRARGPAGAAHA